MAVQIDYLAGIFLKMNKVNTSEKTVAKIFCQRQNSHLRKLVYMAISLTISQNRSVSDNISGDFEKYAFYIKENV